MLVSVIIPCFNVDDFIVRCVNSVLHQTYENIEIICVDNNSTDLTFQILDDLRQQYPAKIKVYREKKKGACAARNKGLWQAKGDYIQFLDADDTLIPDKIEHQVKLMSLKNYPDIIAGAYRVHNLNKKTCEVFVSNESFWSSLINVKLGITSANLFKRSALLSINGWNEEMKSSQEYDLMFRLMKNGAEILVDNLIKTDVFKKDNSITTSNIKLNIIRRFKHLKRIKEYLGQNTGFGAEKERAIQMMFDVTRELCNYSPREGHCLFKRNFNRCFNPEVSSATGTVYNIFYKVFGFDIAQKIFYFKQYIKNKL